MKVLTWNLGLFFYFKYYKLFNLKLKNQSVFNEYFQFQYINFVVGYIQKENPDICFLQEFYSDNERNELKNRLIATYPYWKTVSTWYHEHSIVICSKAEIDLDEVHNTEFYCVHSFGMSFVPIHLNSFSPRKRLEQIKKLISNISFNPDFILGDTNFWSYGNFFLTASDKKAHKILSGCFVNASGAISHTTKMKLNLDRIYVSNKIRNYSTKCPHISEMGMDHFPLFIEV